MLIRFGGKDDYSYGGRIINREMNKEEIISYLNLSGNVNIGVFIEFKQFERKYFNKNIDIVLNDKILEENYRIIEKGKYVNAIIYE